MKIANTPGLKSILQNHYGIALMAYYVVMAFVGMLIPDDILRNYSGTKEFSDFMASFIPQIDRVTALNIKPDVNRFYFSVLWAGSPVLVVVVFGGILNSLKQGTSPLLTKSFRHFAFPMVVVAFGCLAAWRVTWLVDPALGLSRYSFGTPLGRGIIASSLAFSIIFFCPIIISWAIGWLTGYIPRNIKQLNAKNG